MRIIATVTVMGFLMLNSLLAQGQTYDKPVDAPTSSGPINTHNTGGDKPHPKGPIDPHKPGGIHALRSSGRITAVDATAKTITVKDTYSISDETKFTERGKAITMDDLRVGDSVAVTYTEGEDGKLIASKITVTSKPKKM